MHSQIYHADTLVAFVVFVVFVLILQLYLLSILGQLQCNIGETATPLPLKY